MNTCRHTLRRTRVCVLLACVGALAVIACSTLIPARSATPVPTSAPPPTVSATSLPPAPAPTSPVAVDTVAKDIAAGAGQVTQLVSGDPVRVIVVLEERHSSPAGQVQTAIVLNRLYERYGLRHIGLEGSFAAEGNLDAAWSMPSFTAGHNVGAREDIMVQLLEGGEINNGEMLGLTYADVAVAGIENPEEYAYEPPAEAWNAVPTYFYLIAEPGLTQREQAQANDLFSADQIREAYEFVIGTNEWTSERYARTQDDTNILSSEEWLQMIDDLEAKAAEVGADITTEDEDYLQAVRMFYELSSARSRTMVGNTLALLEKSPGAPVAMIIGQGHTKLVAQLLTEQGVSFAVIRNNSLVEHRANGSLGDQAYDRKTMSLSVDPVGGLGALLDGRKKPRPVVGESWFRSKFTILRYTDCLAQMPLIVTPTPTPTPTAPPTGVPTPGLPCANLLSSLSQFTGVTLDPTSILADGSAVTFSITASDRNGRPVTIWVGARAIPASAKTLEERLFEALAGIQSKAVPGSDEEPAQSAPVLTRVSSVTVAKFSTDRAEISAAALDER